MSLYPKDQEITIFGEKLKYPNMGENGKFTNGSFSDPKIKPSFIPAETINLILDNLENVIKEAGIETNNQDTNQLINAVRKLAGNNIDKFKYKLEEFDTGKNWIDDRIIYGRVFVIENLNSKHFPIEVYKFDNIDKMIDYKIIGIYNYDIVKQLFKNHLINKDKTSAALALYIENNILYFHCLTNPDLIINNNDNKLEVYVEYIKNNKTLLIISPLSLDLYEDIDSISELQVNTDAETFEARIENQEIASLIIEKNKLRVVQKKIGSSNIIIEAQAAGREKTSATIPIQIKERPITTLTLSSQSGNVKQGETISITAETNADAITAKINNSNAQISVSGKTIKITGKNVGTSVITVTACLPNSIPVTRQYNLNIKINKYLNALAYAKINGYKTIGQAFILDINWTLVNWNWNNNDVPVTLKIYVNDRLSQTISCIYYSANNRFSDKTTISIESSFDKKSSFGWRAMEIVTERTSMTDLVVFAR
ncbi:hypothetical protein [uncultured Brachyspira sp.]|uniref:hypothetical protein n=1 Tax=uncultured Brachyspira sp. TaxID=221953 RepID=UPI00258BE0AE|nr:hypothetical protein [uncultured Brachyspira sp.]